MATLLLTDRRDPRCVISERSHPHSRLFARLRAWRLDRALAAGVSADSSTGLSLRAQELIGPAARGELARRIRSVIAQAKRPAAPRNFSVPICRRKVLAAEATLEAVADRLLADGPIDARGVAQVTLLLSDGTGPLYNRPGASDLKPVLRAALGAFELIV